MLARLGRMARRALLEHRGASNRIACSDYELRGGQEENRNAAGDRMTYGAHRMA
jgi:hypothetical protein